MSTPTFRSPIASATRREHLRHHGEVFDLFGIYMVNLLLTIVTLGIYRFWAKTRIRRYLWSHTEFLGDRFEYTGTGKELLIGFLIVFTFLAVQQSQGISETRVEDHATALVVEQQARVLLFGGEVRVVAPHARHEPGKQWHAPRSGKVRMGALLATGALWEQKKGRPDLSGRPF